MTPIYTLADMELPVARDLLLRAAGMTDNARITELLEANNREVERRRAATARADALHALVLAIADRVKTSYLPGGLIDEINNELALIDAPAGQPLDRITQAKAAMLAGQGMHPCGLIMYDPVTRRRARIDMGAVTWVDPSEP